MFIRRNVGGLGSDWADPILWYARGVADMKSRALDDPTSWRFYAAMHGIYEPFWQHYGYLRSTDTLPGQPLVDRFWNQCQHGSWYFLPWHRGYLLAFEAVVRDAVLKAGGPSDWALPYWNYFKSGQSRLPPAFNSPNWPDGQNDNPLFVEPRWGPNNDGNVFVPLSQVNLNALADPDFTGGSSGGSPGFGGVDTGFEHGGQVHGRIESQPHDWVHSLIGGGDPNDPNMPGLMSDPDVAGLDPIFWLHHANIDRLWSVWRNNPASHADPTQSNWTAGPASIGERAFSMPMPDGTRWDYTPKDVEDTRTLGYEYDDISPPAGVPAPHDRLIGLGIAPAAAAQAAKGAVPMADHRQVELIGANTAPLKIGGNGAQTTLKLAPEPKTKMLNSLAAAPRTAAPDRIFLNLENVRGTADATALHVYVDIPDGAAPTDHPDHLAGSISLFGVRKASSPDGDHAGKGLTFVLDISSIIDAMHLQRRLDPNSLKISIVPVKPIADQTQVSVGRVSVYRQGQ